METLLQNNPIVKRLLVAILTGAVIALNKKLGLGLEAVDIGALVSLAVVYIGQSGLKAAAEAKAKGQTAADAIKTLSDADVALRGPNP